MATISRAAETLPIQQPISDPLHALRSLLAEGYSVGIHNTPGVGGYSANACNRTNATEHGAEVWAEGLSVERTLMVLATRCGLNVREPNVRRAVETLREALNHEVRPGAGLRLSSAFASMRLALRELGVEL